MPSIAQIVKDFEKLQEDRGGHDQMWERMAPYLSPSRVGIAWEYAIGDSQTRGVYDSTTMMASELMAMFVAGHTINPGQQWMEYGMTEKLEPGDRDEITEYLEECRTLNLKRMAASMFYAEGVESLIDWGGFGTGCLFGEETPQSSNETKKGFRGFYFNAERTGRFWIKQGLDGRVNHIYRKFKDSAGNIRDRWFRNSQAGMPARIAEALEHGKADKMFDVLHVVCPRALGEQGYGNKGMPWASYWIALESKELIYESGYKRFPAAVFRYHRTPGDVYGRGRGHLAFPDTWTLNTAKRMGLEDWALKIRPPILHGHDTVMGSLRLTPAGNTVVNTHGRNIRESIMPYETGSRPEVSHIKEEELRATIRQIFYVDHILKLLETEKSEMTAYEFAKKIELLFRLIGPVYGRLQWEWLYQIVELSWSIQYDAGAFPPAPPAMQRTTGNIDVVFHNPIAKAQRSGDVEALGMAIGDAAPLVQVFGAEILDRLDADKSVDGILERRGVPAEWQRSDREIGKRQAARAAQAQNQLALQQAQQVAEVAQKGGAGLKSANDAGLSLTGGGAKR